MSRPSAPVPFAAHPATGRTAIQFDDGFVYIVPAGGPYQAARWESTRRHWNTYWSSVHEPAGWVLVCPGTYASGSDGAAVCGSCGDQSDGGQIGLPCGRVEA